MVIPGYGFTNKEQLIQYYLDPRNRNILKVNQKLLAFIYEKHGNEARSAECEFA